MATELVQVCKSFTVNPDETATCDSIEWVQAYLLPVEAGDELSMLLQGGFSTEYFQIGFVGTLTLFAVGFTVGLVIAQLRKIKRG